MCAVDVHDVHCCAGQQCMSLTEWDDAVSWFAVNVAAIQWAGPTSYS